jgi:pimeloyl-ACP methyl ester carboxylesterase
MSNLSGNGSRRASRLGDPDVHTAITTDNVGIRLTHYHGGDKGPVILAPGYGTSTLAFTTDTVDTNFPEFLYDRGYDIWLLDYRASPLLPSAATQYNVDDVATHDWPTAVAAVRDATRADTVQVVGHCVGSMTMNMALAAGLKNIRSFVSSQVALHPVVVPLVRTKALLHLATAYKALAKTMTTDYLPSHLSDRAIEQLMHLYPRERCTSPVCRRILFFYGEVFVHDQLNEATHQLIHSMFGAANMTVFQHMSLIFAKGHVVDAYGGETYLNSVANMAVPITYIHGARNHFFEPEGTEETLDLLQRTNDPKLYKRIVFPQYAHMDCFIGKNASRDIFPTLVDELDRFN